MIEPFRIHVSDDVLTDLHERLARTRWPDHIAAYGWEQGTEPGYLYALTGYWRDGYDWRRHEALLNGFDQYMAEVQGLRLHLIHQRSPHAHARPLLLLHGWPGSVYEFYKLIPRLTRPEEHGGEAADAFHVVAPALPGYGFSDAPREPGMTPRRMAALFHELMTEVLGYEQFGAQGGDWGSVVASWLAFDFPRAVAALHLNMVALRPHLGGEVPPLTDEEQAFVKQAQSLRKTEMGYQEIQGTRPQTLGYALNDSPAGLAAWFVEKFRIWSDCDGDIERSFNKDELLTNLMLYWVTGSITSSMRLYFEFRHNREDLPPGRRVETPTGLADFPKEILRPPRGWMERAYNLVHHTVMPCGGHFAALEQPALLGNDIRAFFGEHWR